ncbi:hypothetical protein CBOM_07131 [Ceraceosorus bombacis]|uniref:Uncharacterized protein n=1 Tax=Ceraceosorus bombacis TaxID=401625 RepID=A0A0P1B8P7_9BASI|nr:hypothetical protein CBOM_07131 [Ceraceosorus bombacis]
MPAARSGKARVLVDIQGPSTRRTQNSSIATFTKVSKRSEVKEGELPSRSTRAGTPRTLSELTVTSPRRTRSGRAVVATRAVSTESQRVPKALRPADSEVDRKDDRTSTSTKPHRSPSSMARAASPIATKEQHTVPSSTSFTSESRRAKVAERLRQKAKRAASGKTLVSEVIEQAAAERAGDDESHRQQGEDTMRAVLSSSGSSAHSTSDKENVPLAHVCQRGKAGHPTRDQEHSGSSASSSFGKMEEQQHSTPIAARTSEQRARQDARVRTPLVALPLEPRPSTLSILDAHRLGSRECEREGLNLGVIADQPAGLSTHAQQLSRLPLPNIATFKNFDPSRRTTVRSPLIPANDTEGAFYKLRRERPEASSTRENVARMFASPSSGGALPASTPFSDAARSLEAQIRSEPLPKGAIPRAGQVAPPITSKTGAEDARNQETRNGSASSSQLKRAQRGAFSASNSIGSSDSSLPDASTTLLQSTTTRMGEQSMEDGGVEEAEISAAPVRRSTRRKVATSRALIAPPSMSATVSENSLPSAQDEVIAFSSTSSSSIKDADSETGSAQGESDRMTLDDLVGLLPRGGKSSHQARSSLGGATKRKSKASTRTNSRSRTRATKKDARCKVDLVESGSGASQLSGEDSEVLKRRRKAGTTAAGKVQSGKKQKKVRAESPSVGTRASSGRRGRRSQKGSAHGDVRDASAPASDGAGDEHQDTPRTQTRKRRIQEMEELDRFQLESELVI